MTEPIEPLPPPPVPESVPEPQVIVYGEEDDDE